MRKAILIGIDPFGRLVAYFNTPPFRKIVYANGWHYMTKQGEPDQKVIDQDLLFTEPIKEVKE